jgi:hypothetical protein
MRVFRQAESRFGLLPIRRRRLTACGIPPVGPVPPVFPWCDVYGAGEPTTGARFCREWPYLHAANVQLCVELVAEAFPDRLNLLLLDTSGAQTAQQLTLPANGCLVFLPPYGPARNPIARGWRDLKDALAWLHFTNLHAPQDDLADLLRASEAARLPSLTSYTSLVEAIHALST